MPYRMERFQAVDGIALHANVWLPSDPVRAVMLLVHGIVEHSGRYSELARRLNEGGCGVYGLDLRGHGRSEGKRLWIERFEQYVEDVSGAVEWLRSRHPAQPVFLFGHSMGGAVVLRFSLTRRPDVQGLVLSAPALKLATGVYPLLRHLAAVAGRLAPRLGLVRMSGACLSRDPQVVADFRQDPLVFRGRVPNRTAAEVLRIARWLSANLDGVEQPFIVYHGTGDRVTAVEGSRQLYARAVATDKTLRLYDGLYHDLWHEPEWEQLAADLSGWIAARCEPWGG
ncbi:MAG TPA: alpha/beta hydrolase [Planctomycetaceae bacterium]|nr:alpha/beta hydrolase [Planctomycetaceae bacterium]HIQ20310.1 alpha/beta hydrolase [Planctomycetota bacterium]